MSVQNLTPGQTVTCPKCGSPGVVAIDVFSAKGRKYQYLVVRHKQNGTVRRCLVQRLAEAQAVAKPRAKPSRAKPRARQARLQVEAPAPAPAPVTQLDMKAIVEEVVKAAVTETLKTVNAEVAKVLAETVSAAVREALAAVRAELEAQRAQLQRIEDSVRQRKGEGAKAVQRGEVKVSLKPGSLHWQICEVLRGKEMTKEEIARELERRFNRRISGNSLSGRLSELRGAGYVECRRQGKTWLWRLVREIPAGSAERRPETRHETRPAAQQPARQHQSAPAYVAPARTDIPAASSQAETAGLPSFAVGNPWLEILSGRGEVLSGNTRVESGASASQSGLPSFAVDNPWLSILARR
jgi:DNA-binding transcriptional ArsR family regulator